MGKAALPLHARTHTHTRLPGSQLGGKSGTGNFGKWALASGLVFSLPVGMIVTLGKSLSFPATHFPPLQVAEVDSCSSNIL